MQVSFMEVGAAEQIDSSAPGRLDGGSRRVNRIVLSVTPSVLSPASLELAGQS